MKYRFFLILMVVIAVILGAYFVKQASVPKSKESIFVKENMKNEYDKQRIQQNG